MKLRWTDKLDEGVYNRLTHCKSRKEDIKPLVQAKWDHIKSNNAYCKEDALIIILELLSENSCEFDLTREEYNEILSYIY